MDFVENLAIRNCRRRVCLAGAQRSQPFCRARQRTGECPLDKNHREPGDQNRLDQGIEQGIAKGAGDLSVDVPGVVEENQRARNFTVMVKRQRINVNRGMEIFIGGSGLLRTQEFAYTGVLLGGPSGSRWTHLEGRRETGSDRQHGGCFAVHRDAFQMLALTEALDETLQAFIRCAVEQRLHTLLETFTENFRAVRKVASQSALLRAHLVCREE